MSDDQHDVQGDAIDAAVDLLEEEGYLIVQPQGVHVSVVDCGGGRARVKVIAGAIGGVTDMLRRFGVLLLDTRADATVERLRVVLEHTADAGLEEGAVHGPEHYYRLQAQAVLAALAKGGEAADADH